MITDSQKTLALTIIKSNGDCAYTDCGICPLSGGPETHFIILKNAHLLSDEFIALMLEKNLIGLSDYAEYKEAKIKWFRRYLQQNTKQKEIP